MVTSSGGAYLLAMASISSDVLGFFMASLQIKDESLSPFLKNMMMDLSSTSEKMFLLLHKHWMNSRRDSLLLYDVGQVPIDSCLLASGLEVTDELST
jgi:hypothetical protein